MNCDRSDPRPVATLLPVTFGSKVVCFQVYDVVTRGRVSDGRNGKRAASPHHPSSLPLLGSLPFTLCLTPPHAPFTPLRSCPSSTPLHSVPSRRGEVTEERRNRAPKGRDEEWKDDTTPGSRATRDR